jgi:hypothetical protein
MAHGSFLVAAGQQMYLFSEPYDDHHREPEASPETLFEHVARRNGPLEDYNPQMLLQCLLWGAFISSCLTQVLNDSPKAKSDW